MRYFSEIWSSGDLTEEQGSAIRDAYWARIEALKPQLSPAVRKLAVDINLHDGLIRCVTLDRGARILTISLRCGDLQIGYCDVDLSYVDVDTDRLDVGMLRAIATDTETELRYDEIDLELPNSFVHRILFAPAREIEIVFRSLRLSTEPQPDRELGEDSGQYREASGAG
ncbi:MAG TPA: hypothetical protein VFE33_15600 [Thermoanaerobaculia bacterium]|nr:hypothetical protein [Thermoanaerobaculia bacterium]